MISFFCPESLKMDMFQCGLLYIQSVMGRLGVVAQAVLSMLGSIGYSPLCSGGMRLNALST